MGCQEYTVILILLLFNEIINLIYTTSKQKFLLLKLNVSYDTINYITDLQELTHYINYYSNLISYPKAVPILMDIQQEFLY